MALNIGIVGTGGFAQHHARIMARMENVQVKAFLGTSLEKAEQAAAAYSEAKAYSDLDAFLEKEKLDAVYICVPPMAHGTIEEAVIARGLPMFIEKPLGVTAETTERLLTLIRGSSLLTSVGYHWRYTDAAARARQLLTESPVGMANGYWLGSMPGVAWWRQLELSGGQFVEQTTHITDLMRYLLGEAAEVYAAFAKTDSKPGLGDVPDVGSVTVKLRGGAIATLTNTCLLPMYNRTGLDLFTSEGLIEVHGDRIRELRPNRTIETKNQTDPYLAENEAFLHAVRTGDRSRILSDYEDAVKTHRISAAALESSSKGLPIKLG